MCSLLYLWDVLSFVEEHSYSILLDLTYEIDDWCLVYEYVALCPLKAFPQPLNNGTIKNLVFLRKKCVAAWT